MNSDDKRKLFESVRRPISAAVRRDQRVSFVYGNGNLEDERVTRDVAAIAVERVDASK
jgi:hypothetical protein